KGKTFRLRRVRDGMEITIGGPILFEPFSAELTGEGREALNEIAEMLKGHRNKIEVRGHAAEEPRPADWDWDDAVHLSYERARHVAEELIGRGADPRAIRLIASGASEPIKRELYGTPDAGQNRRVEIIIREAQGHDYVGQAPVAPRVSTQPAGLRAEAPVTPPVGWPAPVSGGG